MHGGLSLEVDAVVRELEARLRQSEEKVAQLQARNHTAVNVK